MNKRLKMDTKALEIPLDHTDCPPEIIIQLVVDMFNRIIQHNDKVPVTSQTITRFHSRTATPITIHDYIHRIHKYVIVEKAVLLMLVVFVDRMTKVYPSFILSSLTAHRYFNFTLVYHCCGHSMFQIDIRCVLYKHVFRQSRWCECARVEYFGA
jgi:hypothetical protein